MRVVFTLDQTVQVFIFNHTSNGKIAKQKVVGYNKKTEKDITKSIEKIVQTYTYSIDQFNYIKNCLNEGIGTSMKDFFSLDAKNCFDCPFSINSGSGGCYTHKYEQYLGMISSLKSIAKKYGSFDNIPQYNNDIYTQLVNMAKNRYVRFGTYGEPSMHPIEVVQGMSTVSKNWTGYTHQWFKKPEYAEFFMASVHSPKQAVTAAKMFNYRSYVAVKDNLVDSGMVHCPASKEAGYKSNCAQCGLCSGTTGKGKKNIYILEH